MRRAVTPPKAAIARASGDRRCEKARQFVAENDNVCYKISCRRNCKKNLPPDHWKEERALASDLQAGESGKRFFIFIRRNALKRPDSEKLMKANESNFAFIYLHFLSFAFGRSSRTLVARLGRAGA
jgi:hypothetical protein